MINNLKGLPKIYYINLDRSKDRNLYMLKQFKKYNITNFERVSATDYLNTNIKDIVINDTLEKESGLCTTYTHLKTIKKFLNSDEDYAIICEDDVDFSTSENWTFCWKDIFNNINNKIDILQMCISTRLDMDINFHLHNRSFWDFNCTAYFINKKIAKKILDEYLVDNKINLSNYKYRKIFDKQNKDSYQTIRIPTNEEIIYNVKKETTYSMPLFTYSLDFISLLHPDHFEQAKNSRDRVVNFWQNIASNFSIDDLLN